MRILYDNEVLTATITASSETTYFEFDTALVDTRLSRVGRTTGDTSENIVFDMGAAVDVSYVAILAHNLTGSATVTLEGNASDSWGAPSFSQSITAGTDALIENFTEDSYRYWRLTFADASNPDGYIQIGYVYLGTFLQMPGMSPGQIIPRKSNSSSQKSQSGQLYGDVRLKFKAAEINIPVAEESDRTAINTFFNTVDVVRPFILLIWESDLTVEAPIYCNLIEDLAWNKLATREGLLWTLGLKFEEVF